MVTDTNDTNPFIAVGNELATAREAQKLSLSDISGHLRISVKYLEYLEAGENSKLPGATYVLGFVRSYAKFLNLDANAMCQRLSDEIAASGYQPEYHFVENKVSGGSEWRNMLMIGAVLMVVSYTAWYFLWNDYVPDAELTASTELSTELAEQDTPPTDDISGKDLPDTGLSQTEQDSMVSETTENIAIDPAPPEQADLPSNTGVVPEPDEASPALNNVTNMEGTDGLAITALDDVWVELSTPIGQQVLAKLITKGEVIAIPDDNYILTTGNAGAISLGYVDQDTPWQALGVSGQVLNKKPIDTLLLNN
ncbi:MAG: RodZ domain-containing protein [Candidatus Puniceispirillales bacterium]